MEIEAIQWLWSSVLEYGWIGLLSFMITYVPWMTPIKLAAISGMILASKTPFVIFLFATGGAILGTISLMVINKYASDWIKQNISIKERWRKDPGAALKDSQGRAALKNWQEKLYQKLHTTNNKIVYFILVILGTYSIIPDIIIIRLIQNKLGATLFLIATILGKSITNFVFIFGVDSLMKLFS